ncbi:MAG: hypothetical protein U0746_06760 [Gemmataceae bacterium]
MNIRFACPACDVPDRVDVAGRVDWRCAACAHSATLTDTRDASGKPTACVLCGCGDLYRQKDFPQWLGLSLLAAACASFFVLQILYHWYAAWAILLGSAAIDGFLYYGIVGDVVVCYRCAAQHRGVPAKAFDPHELAKAERYRQERIRLEQANGRR